MVINCTGITGRVGSRRITICLVSHFESMRCILTLLQGCRNLHADVDQKTSGFGMRNGLPGANQKTTRASASTARVGQCRRSTLACAGNSPNQLQRWQTRTSSGRKQRSARSTWRRVRGASREVGESTGHPFRQRTRGRVLPGTPSTTMPPIQSGKPSRMRLRMYQWTGRGDWHRSGGSGTTTRGHDDVGFTITTCYELGCMT
jgi:hypothetical protein